MTLRFSGGIYFRVQQTRTALDIEPWPLKKRFLSEGEPDGVKVVE